jgi:hypothetical protein
MKHFDASMFAHRATSLHFSWSFAKAIELANECFLQLMISRQRPLIGLDKFQKRCVEVVSVDNLLVGAYGGDGRPLRLYDPAVLGPRLVQEGASDANIELGGRCGIEDLAKWLASY